MKPRKSKRAAYTPSFPELRDQLIAPVSAKGEPPAETTAPSSFLPGLAQVAENDKPPFGSARWWKSFDLYCASDLWKRRARRRLGGPNCPCSEPRCPRVATEVHHLNYDRWGTGEELDSDLLPLCKTHHDIADARRRKERDRKNEEALEEAREDAACERFVAARTGGAWVGSEELDELREEFDQWWSDREEGGYE
jgi:hypothetical protein